MRHRRVGLCQVLLKHPDLLLLDEPTNHLDVEGIRWLEQFLSRPTNDLRAGACVFITHDRAFLEAVATRVIELSRAYPQGTLAVDGGYADEAGSWSLLHVEFLESPARLSQLLSIKPERGCLLTDIEYEAREAWAKNTK